MKIQIDGTNTVNKGAELMLYSILKEIEAKYPNSKVIYNDNTMKTPNGYISTKLDFEYIEDSTLKKNILKRFKVLGILHRLCLPFNEIVYKKRCKDLDILLDGAGYRFNKFWKIGKIGLYFIENYYRFHFDNGTKIVFLPQAFGPFDKYTKEMSSIINKYIHLLFARDEDSRNYLISIGVKSEKIQVKPDFTAKYSFVSNLSLTDRSVLIIPNSRMIDKTNLLAMSYVNFLVDIINELIIKGHKVELLNHEGFKDELLCNKIVELSNSEIRIHTKLNALEIKKIISDSKLVISSRYHGCASALSSYVPCLATSWSHKYEQLFSDYKVNNMIIDVNNKEEAIGKIFKYLNLEEYTKIKTHLEIATSNVVETNNVMWNDIWSLL